MTVSDADLSAFAASHDIISLGIAADEVRRRLHGSRTTFVRVANLDAAPGSAVEIPAAAHEVRIVGVPASREAAVQRVAEVAAIAGATPLSAYSLADLEEISAREHVTLRSFLEDLASVGLELVSEAPFDRLRDPRRSIEEVNIGGLRLARLTIQQLSRDNALGLYRQIAALQYEVGVVLAFAPLPRKMNPAAPTTGYDDVKRVALARLCLQDIPSIQVDWSLYGPKLAQVALTVGADDVDGVSATDDVSEGPRRTELENVRRNITAAGLVPVERDGRFDPAA